MIRFGCLGAARITPKALIEPVKSHSQFEVIAVAARSARRARIFADEHGIPNIETDYTALIERPDVDVIYNALPPSRHADLTIKALEAGKPILALGGGAMMDLGCYPLHWARSLLSNEPEIVSAEAVIGRPGIDLSMRAEMIFDGGVKATITTSMAPGAKRNTGFKITGCDAMLHFENPIAPHLGYRITLHPVNADEPIVVAEEVQSQETTYHHQLAHFLDCLSGEAEPLLPPSDGVANMVAIDAIYKAAGLKPRGMPD